MTKIYKGSLSLEWYNKQKSILIRDATQNLVSNEEVAAPVVNWINKDEALFYEVVDDGGTGLKPFWVNSNDLRVKEARPLVFQKAFVAHETDKPGTIPGTVKSITFNELAKDD